MSVSPRSVPEDWVFELAERARAVDGSPPFSDQAIVDYRTGARSLVAIDEVAAALVTAPAPVTVPGMAERLGVREAELVVDPDARGRGVGTALLEHILSPTPGRPTSATLIWAHGDHPGARALAASHGLVAVRELLHLSGPLDRAPRDVAEPSHIGTFVAGQDEAEWVALNSLIFAAHAEQGSVTVADLDQLESEPWFSADDFLLLREGGILIGYCWLKVEGDLGEIYVLGVHPSRHGQGLGGLLLEAGLARLRERGIHLVHLYVEGDNEAALRLYRSRGLEQDSIDIQYSSAR
jgi:mycothiol synthase